MSDSLVVLDAESCLSVPKATVSRDSGSAEVAAEGFQTKRYEAGHVPPTVRLLRAAPALYLDRPTAVPGQNVTIRFNAPVESQLSMRIAHPTPGDRQWPLGRLSPAEGMVPDEDPVGHGLDWPAYEFTVPTDIRSGIWLIELDGAAGHAVAPLVVGRQTALARTPLLTLASVGTWFCYNHWGGRNRYRNNEFGYEDLGQGTSPSRRPLIAGLARALPEVPRSVLKRQLGLDRSSRSFVSRRLSSQRPLGHYVGHATPPDQPALCHLAALDIKILSWLDRQGIEYECVPDLELDKRPELAIGRDAIALMGHSEYWSSRMLDCVEEAHADGAWILNISGNTMYRQIAVDDDYSVRLVNIVTRLSGRDETRLTGARYSEVAYGTAAPYRVTRPNHWIFDRVDVTDGSLFALDCLVDNAGSTDLPYDPSRPTTPDRRLSGRGGAGFEVDRRPIHRRGQFTLVAEGTSRRSAEMLVKEPKGSKGGTFSASSINFGGSLLVDEISSAMMMNVLRRAVPAAVIHADRRRAERDD